MKIIEETIKTTPITREMKTILGSDKNETLFSSLLSLLANIAINENRNRVATIPGVYVKNITKEKTTIESTCHVL